MKSNRSIKCDFEQHNVKLTNNNFLRLHEITIYFNFSQVKLTFKMKLSSGCSFRSIAACLTVRSNSASLFLGTSNAGNRSPIKPMNTGVSSVTIFGILKSLRALINTSSSGRPGSPL